MARDWAREKVDKLVFSWGPGFDYRLSPVARDRVVKLLKAERARARRVVNRLLQQARRVTNDREWNNGYSEACRDILKLLQ